MTSVSEDPPQTDVVLKGKLDPVDNLRDLRYHGQHGYSYEVLMNNERDSEG